MENNVETVERDDECYFFRVGYGVRSESWRIVQFDKYEFRIMHIVNEDGWFKKEYIGGVFLCLDDAKDCFNKLVKEVCVA